MWDEDKASFESKFETFFQPWWVALVVSNGGGFCFLFFFEDYFGGCAIGGRRFIK